MPSVSIVVPVYNTSRYLEECLDSLCAQTLKDIEIICVNDGSTDASLSILERYARGDNRIKIINKENSGYGHTMNVGIAAAAGEYVGIVESDDYVKLEMYEELYEIAVQSNLDFVKADFYRFSGQGGSFSREYIRLIGDRDKDRYYNRTINPQEEIEVSEFIMNTWCGIYRKDFLRKNNIRHNTTPGASFQDNGFWIQTFVHATKVMFIDKPYYLNRRDNPDSSVKSKKKIFCANQEYEFIRSVLRRDPKVFKKYNGVYTLKKYHNYIFTFNRIDEHFKQEYVTAISKEFREDKRHGELDLRCMTDKEKRSLRMIINSPKVFLLKEKVKPFFMNVSIKNG